MCASSLGEASHASHPVELARLLKTMDQPEFGDPQRQIAVTSRFGLINLDVMRTVHRPQQVAVAVGHLDRRKLAVGIVRIMARGFVQMNPADRWRVDGLVSPSNQFAVEERLKLVANDRSLGQPKDQARANLGINQEQFELFAEHAVVAAFGLFEPFEVFFQVGLVEPRRAVEPLQLTARGIALPIRAGDRQQSKCTDRAGRGYVWP